MGTHIEILTGAWREKNSDAIGCKTDDSDNFMLELCQLV